METKRIPVPVFVTIPAGTGVVPCPGCSRHVYGVGLTGRTVLVDCYVMGGFEPRLDRAGSGIAHTCGEGAK